MRFINATDLGIDLDTVESPPVDTPWIYLEGCVAWSMDRHAAAYLGISPCPVCGGQPPRRKCYCLGCDRTGLDDKATFPGLKVDERPDPEWEPGEAVRL